MNEEKKKENYSMKKNRKYVYTKLLLQKKKEIAILPTKLN